jgi:hypothetical protein
MICDADQADGGTLAVPMPHEEDHGKKPWPHSDQSAYRPWAHCIQGLLNLVRATRAEAKLTSAPQRAA